MNGLFDLLKRRFIPTATRDAWLNRAIDQPKERMALAVIIVIIALVIFAIDFFTQTYPKGVFYAVLLLLAAGTGRRDWVLSTAALAIVLTTINYIVAPYFLSHSLSRIISISFVTYVLVRFLWATHLLRERAHLLDQTHDCISTYDLDGRVIFWNEGARALYGWDRYQACGVVNHTLLKTEYPSSREQFLKSLIDNGHWEGQITNVSKDGERFTMDCRCSLLKDERGKPRAILETSTDITRRNELNMAVRRSEARFRDIFETAAVSTWECDISAVRLRLASAMRNQATSNAHSYFEENPEFIRSAIDLTFAVDVNAASVKIFGAANKSQLLGPIGRFWPPAAEKSFAKALLSVCENAPRFEGDAVLRTIVGGRIEVFFTLSRSADPLSPDTVFMSLVDVTAYNQARVALQSARIELAHAAQLTSLGELTASIAHEVNQPLAVIMSNGQAGLRWLRKPDPDIGAATISLEQVVGDAKRAAAIISSLQSLARKEPAAQVRTELNEIVSESLRLLGSEVARCSISTEIKLVSRPLYVFVDRIQIQQVVVNIVTNAIQAMDEVGNVSRILYIETSMEGHQARVVVEDTGPGIDHKLEGKLFNAFSTTKPEGMGLGLSICSSIILRHEGRISVENSKGGGGARFTFWLPLLI